MRSLECHPDKGGMDFPQSNHVGSPTRCVASSMPFCSNTLRLNGRFHKQGDLQYSPQDTIIIPLVTGAQKGSPNFREDFVKKGLS